METAASRYTHTEIDHNLKDPSILVPLFHQMFSPQSVCDVGCGVGNFLYVFKQLGVQKMIGIDGFWVNKEILSKYLSEEEFVAMDFEELRPLSLPKFDLCICLEVAEHIAEEHANRFIDLLTSISDTLIFSAALPYQGGINHINEQKEEYWERKFNKRGFTKYDIIRHQVFFNRQLSSHYRRNIVVYSKRDLSHFKNVPFGELAILENCKERIYKDLMSDVQTIGKLSRFFLKILLVKLSGKKITGTLKKLRGVKV